MIQYKNNAASNLLSGITDTDLSLTVGTGDGGLFPALSGDDVFFVTLSGTVGYEIVKVTARSTDTFTIVRAQEGTTAKAFAMGDKVEMLITAGHFEDLRDNSLRLDNVPTDVISGLNADKLDGLNANDFYLAYSDLKIFNPRSIEFEGPPREDIKLLTSYETIDNDWLDVALLLSCNGSLGSGVFTDSSINNFTISTTGSVVHSSLQSKFGGLSAYYDYTGGYLNVPSSALFDFSSVPFTIEFWIYVVDLPPSGGYYRFLDFGTNGSQASWQCWINEYGQIGFAKQTGGTLGPYTNSGAITEGVWIHVAMTSPGVTGDVWINGINATAGSTCQRPAAGNVDLKIGRDPSFPTNGNSGFYYFNGFFDELRITRKVRYTANFLPPTSPFPVTTWTDQLLDPYYLNTSLLLHFNGTSGSQAFTDDSITPKSITAYGNAQISSTQSKFGGVSGYFDGNSDYLSIPHNTALDLSSGNFTIETWFFIPTGSGSLYHTILSKTKAGTNGIATVRLHIYNFNFYCFFRNSSDTAWELTFTPSTVISENIWHHVAIVRYGNQFTLFYDGVSIDTGTSSASLLSHTDPLILGYLECIGAEKWYLKGYLDEFRITKGIARYTTNFTPAALPFAGIKNLSVDQDLDKVSLLLHFNGSNLSTCFIDSSPNQKAITRYGDTKISITQSKFGGSSAYFDGNGDYLTAAHNSNFIFGTGDFTIEAWVYLVAYSSADFGCIFTTAHPSDYHGIFFSISSSDHKIYLHLGNGSTWIQQVGSSSTVSLNTWTHVAVTRQSNTFRIFQDGTKVAEWTNTINLSNPNNLIAAGGRPRASQYSNMYMDEVRITKGVARYTTSFTPPPVPFVDGNKTISIGTQSNTLYQRSSGNFAWYKGGNYSGTDLDPGVDGSVRMVLSEAGNLLIGTTTDDTNNHLQVNGSIVQKPLASVTPTNNGELVFEATSNTTITVKYKGSDGTVRSGTITLT